LSNHYNFKLNVSNAETSEHVIDIETDSFYELQKEIFKQYFSKNNCKIENRVTGSNFSIEH
jgi:hypothetical protein